MGALFCEALPGTLFYLFGLWHLLNAFYYHIKFKGTRQNHTKKPVISYSFRFCCQTKHIPLEGILKFAICTLGLVVEGYGLVAKDKWEYQNFIVYFFFCFSGLVDILMFYEDFILLKFDYFIHASSFFIEGLQFSLGLHGTSLFHVKLYTHTVYTCYFTFFAVICLMLMNNLLIGNAFYGICLLVQGSWFWQVGFFVSLNVNAYKDCPEDFVKATKLFCCHCILNAVFVSFLYGAMTKIVKPCGNITQYGDVKKEFEIEDG